MDFWNLLGLFPKTLRCAVMRSASDIIVVDLAIDANDKLSDYNHLSKDQRTAADHIISQFRDISYLERGLDYSYQI